MRAHWLSTIALGGLLSGSLQVHAQHTDWGQEYGKRIKALENVTPLADGAFGDNVNLFNGTVSFSVTDVSVPGNNSLPVEFSRSYDPQDFSSERLLGNWDIDSPHIGGTFPENFSAQGYWAPLARCSTVAAPPSFNTGSYIVQPKDYWGGTQLRAGGASGELLSISTDPKLVKPTSAHTFKWTTKDRWFFSCLTSPLKSGHPGEGFVGHSPDGTKYTFDYLVAKTYNGISVKNPNVLYGVLINRKRVRLYASKVEDRFGNWVQYDWTGGRLNRIWSSDGREILLAYTNGYLSSVTVPGTPNPSRTWTYQVAGFVLQTVQNPDGSTWQYASTNPAALRDIVYEPNLSTQNDPFDFVRDDQEVCWPTHSMVMRTGTYSVKNPSGATAQFSFAPMRHGRTNVKYFCMDGVDDNWRTDYNNFPLTHDTISLQSKVVTGPGLAARTTYYSYSSLGAGYRPLNPQQDLLTGATPPPHYKYVTVTDPEGRQLVHRFGKDYELNEGKLLSVETRKNGVLYKTVTHNYITEAEVPSQPFADRVGSSLVMFGDPFTPAAVRPIRSTVITHHQDSATFTDYNNTFDAQARSIAATKFSSLGYSKAETTEYLDDFSLWVLSQFARSTTNGIETSKTDYWAATRLPMRTWSFGKAQQYFVYNGDSTLASMTDGNNNTITLGNWKRGIPQLIQHPATPDQPTGVSQSALVDSHGWIRSITDENGYTTGYDYDLMGRVKRIDYPVGDSVAWNSSNVTFAMSSSPAYGLPAGHWRHTTSTGNGRTIVFLDALWRPVVKEVYDLANVGGTLSQTITRYDAAGRAAFVSYPQRELSPSVIGTWANPAVAPNALGIRTEYDALDRPTAVRQDSELGVLNTLTEYLPGFQTRVTNPRQKTTTTSYLAWDQPSTDLPVSVIHPENARTWIQRDAFGKPLWMKRYGALAGQPEAVRWYLYDSAQQLCKTIEPETAATVMDYDAAGNLLWSASGQALWSTSSCDRTAVAAGVKVNRTYDARRRLKTLSFPDGYGNQTWTYTPDGLADVLTTYNTPNQGEPVISAYHYNKRRMLDGQGETLTQPGWYTWGIGYGYDANGNLARHVYPDGEAIQYAPNALGQSTQAASTFATYASAVQYHANGGIAQFSYGNGILHTTTQNTRQLPSASSDGNASSFQISYDGNGNTLGIADMVQGTGFNRTMTYDDLDRLKTAQSVSFGGTDGVHRFSYDVLDNLKSWTLAGAKDYATYDYNAGNLLTNIRNTGGASVVGIGYDINGNVQNKNGVQYIFDLGNRLRGVLQGASTIETYRYDVHGRRVLSWSPTGGVILSQYGTDGVLRYQSDFRKGKAFSYFYLAGSLVGTHELPLAGGPQLVKFHHTDPLGSPVATTDINQVVVERSEYEPFGKLINRGNDDRPGYTGHVMDAATGLTYMQQRYYDPGIGRFLSVDPVTANPNTGANFNRYTYANNNPYKFTDPDGRNATAVLGAEGGFLVCGPPCAAVGGIIGFGVGLYLGKKIADNIQRSESGDTTAGAKEKVFDGTKPAAGDSGAKGEREGAGGREGRDEALGNVKGERSNPKEGVTVVKLPDGGRVEAHDSTKSRDYPQGTPTIKVQDSSGKVQGTVRYPEPPPEVDKKL